MGEEPVNIIPGITLWGIGSWPRRRVYLWLLVWKAKITLAEAQIELQLCRLKHLTL